MSTVRTVTVHMVKCSVRTVTVRTATDYIDYSTVVPVQPAVNFLLALELTAVNTLTDSGPPAVSILTDLVPSVVNFPPALELTAVNTLTDSVLPAVSILTDSEPPVVNTLTAPVSVAVNSPTEQLLHNADKKPLFHHTVCRKMYIA